MAGVSVRCPRDLWRLEPRCSGKSGTKWHTALVPRLGKCFGPRRRDAAGFTLAGCVREEHELASLANVGTRNAWLQTHCPRHRRNFSAHAGLVMLIIGNGYLGVVAFVVLRFRPAFLSRDRLLSVSNLPRRLERLQNPGHLPLIPPKPDAS